MHGGDSTGPFVSHAPFVILVLDLWPGSQA